MTDPNYWLAAWLAVMAVVFLIISYEGIKAVVFEIKQNRIENETIRAIGICSALLIGNLIAALYCAGFVVVMP